MSDLHSRPRSGVDITPSSSSPSSARPAAQDSTLTSTPSSAVSLSSEDRDGEKEDEIEDGETEIDQSSDSAPQSSLTTSTFSDTSFLHPHYTHDRGHTEIHAPSPDNLSSLPAHGTSTSLASRSSSSASPVPPDQHRSDSSNSAPFAYTPFSPFPLHLPIHSSPDGGIGNFDMASSHIGGNRRGFRRQRQKAKQTKQSNPPPDSAPEPSPKSLAAKVVESTASAQDSTAPEGPTADATAPDHDVFGCLIPVDGLMVHGRLTISPRQVRFTGRAQEPIFRCGFLSKTGRINSTLNRYWFILQDGMLRYYSNPEDTHVLRGNIPITSVAKVKASSKPTQFSLKMTDGSSVDFTADDAETAAEWCEALTAARQTLDVGADGIVIAIPTSILNEFERFDVSNDMVCFNIRCTDSDPVTGNDTNRGSDADTDIDADAAKLEHCFYFTENADQAECALRKAMADASTGAVTEFVGPAEADPEPGSDVGLKAESDAESVTSATRSDRFRARFGLASTERLLWTRQVMLPGLIPVYGTLYVGLDHICFTRLLIGSRLNLVLPLADIVEHKQRWGPFPSLALTVQNQPDTDKGSGENITTSTVVFRFFDSESRDKTDDHIHAWKTQLQHAACDSDSPLEFDDPSASIVGLDPPDPMTIVCVTIGSRGDVQPYIALAKRLQQDNHNVIIATHEEFSDWVLSHNIGFRPLAGNPAELMQLCIENSVFSPRFMYEAFNRFYDMMGELLIKTHEACKGADLVIESPSSMAGIHVAEALRIPYFRAFTMPWTSTSAFPHAFMIPPGQVKLGAMYNLQSYSTFQWSMWTALRPLINKWRVNDLQLKPTSLVRLRQHQIPFLYNFSPSVVKRPADYPDRTYITGYWFLDESVQAGWTPDPALLEFMNKARAEGKKLVYVGFGSIVVSDPVATSRSIVDAVNEADIRCILSKGWSDRLASNEGQTEADRVIESASNVFRITSAPHDWLFRQVDAAVHHGGCGTTGASLRAGLPTVIKPFFADQFFYGPRVQELGVGVFLTSLAAKPLAAAFKTVTQDEDMISRARALGKQIEAENGVETAVNIIYRDLEYAKDLVEARLADAGVDLEIAVKADAGADVVAEAVAHHDQTVTRSASTLTLKPTPAEAAVQTPRTASRWLPSILRLGSASQVPTMPAEAEVEVEAAAELGRARSDSSADATDEESGWLVVAPKSSSTVQDGGNGCDDKKRLILESPTREGGIREREGKGKERSIVGMAERTDGSNV